MINTSCYRLRNKLPLMFSKIKYNNTRFVYTASKNLITMNKQSIRKSKIAESDCNAKTINLLNVLSKNSYCEKIGNLVILNSTSEIKVAFEDKTYSLFFNDYDSINMLNEKILGINEKIQSVEFINNQTNKVLSEEIKNKTSMKELIKTSFLIRINKHISFSFIPGVFPQLLNEMGIAKDLNLNNIDYLKSAEEIKNIILLNLYELKGRKNLDKSIYEEEKVLLITEIMKKLEERENFLKTLFEKQNLSEKMVNDKLIFMSKLAIKLGMLFAVSHFSVFYLLIYKFYAWDVIEPITYIVGNVYWIITLGFLAFKNKKLDSDLLKYESIKDLYFDKYSKQLNYNPEEKIRLQEELSIIKELRSGLAEI